MQKKQVIKAIKNFYCEKQLRSFFKDNIKIEYNNIHLTNLENYLILKNCDGLFNCDETIKILDKKNFLKFYDKKEYINITSDEQTCYLNYKQVNLKIPNHPSHDWIELPEQSDTMSYSVNKEFVDAIIKADTFSDKDKNRYNLDCVCIDFKNEYAISTNQIVLRMEKFNLYRKIERENIFINSNIIKLLEVLKDDIRTINLSNNCIYFEGDDFTLCSRLFDTQFPKYMEAVNNFNNQNLEYEINLDKPELKNILADFDMVICENFNTICCDYQTFYAKTAVGELEYKIFNNVDKKQAIGLNYHYLKDYLKVLDDGFQLRCYGAKKPLVLKDGDNYLFMSPVEI